MKSVLYKLFVGEFSWRRLVRSLLLIPVAVYAGLFFLAWFFPDHLIFRPQPSFYKDDANIIKLITNNGEKISARFYPNENARYTILFSHGNAEDIGGIDSFAETIRDQGFSILTYDYRGYGTSESSPSETHTYGDIDTAFNYLVSSKQIPPERIILHGRSLGGGPSTDLAAREKVAGLILESTFSSAGRVLTNFKVFPFDKYDNLDKLSKVECPVIVIHGKKDRTISFSHGEALFASAKRPKYSLWVEQAGHNNVSRIGGKDYLEAITNFSETLDAR